MSELHAAIGCEQLKKLPKFLKARKRNFELLSKNINKNINILTIQSDESYLRSSYYCLTIVFKNKLINKRDKIMKDINDLGIGTSIYYPHPVPRMNYYKKKYGYLSKNYPHAEIISDQSIAFPVGPHLGIKEILQISKIINKILIKYD